MARSVELDSRLKAMEENLKNVFQEMAQKTIDVFINEIYSKPPKKNYATNKTVVYHIDDIWSLDILDLKDYGPENNRGYVRKPGEKWMDIENHENVQLFESRFFS